MKAHGKIAFLILSLIYLTPDFFRVMNSIPYLGFCSGYSIQKTSTYPNSKAKSSTFQRRRFIPPTKTNEIVTIYSVIVNNSHNLQLSNDYSLLFFNFNIFYKTILLNFSFNKAPPFISC